MKKTPDKQIANNDSNSFGVKGQNEEKALIESNTDNEASTSDDPFFIMTLEFEPGKYKKIKIFPTSDPTELAFNFCKENNLDFNSLKFLTKEISLLLTKYNSKQLDLFQSNNSIPEVEEEHIQTELTKSPEKNEEEKSQRSGNKFIYSSIDSNRNNNNNNNNGNNNETANSNTNNNKNIIIEDQMNRNDKDKEKDKAQLDYNNTVKEENNDNDDDDKHCGSSKEEENNIKSSNTDFMNFKEEYYPSNNEDDHDDIEFIKLNLKAQETNEEEKRPTNMPKDNDDNNNNSNKATSRFQLHQIESDQENTRALLFSNQPQSQSQSKSVQSSLKMEENKTSKPSNTLQSTDNVNENNASSRLSYTMKPHPKLTNFQTEEDELAKLIEIKRKKDEQIRQLQIELEDEEREKQRQREEQLDLEEQDRIEREEFIQYEREQELKTKGTKTPTANKANVNAGNNKETKKKKLTLNEVDYNFIEDHYTQPDDSKDNNIKGELKTNNYKQLVIETTKSNAKPGIPIPNIDTNQHLFQYEILTDHLNTSQRRKSPLLITNAKNDRNNHCVTSSNTQSNIKGDNNGTNTNSYIISQKQNTFSLLKPEMNLNRCCSANIFEKLYSEAELKRQQPKKPCHFSYRQKQNRGDIKSNHTRSMSNSNSTNTHIKINSNDLLIKNKYNKTTSKTPLASNRIQSNQHRKNESYNSTHNNINNINITNTHINHISSHSNVNKIRVRNKIIQKEHNSYSTEANILQTTVNNIKQPSVAISTQSKILKTDHTCNSTSNNNNNIHNYNSKGKNTKKNTLKLLTKKNLTNPFLKKKIEQIKKEFHEKYTFKPKINKQIMYDTHTNTNIHSHNDTKQDIKAGRDSNHRQNTTDFNKGSFTSKDSNSKTKRKDCNAFNKNYDYPAKVKTNRNCIFNKSNDYSEPFKCLNTNTHTNANTTASMISIKKEEGFLRLFRELDDDEDGVITSVHLSTKTIPDNIIALISPILNLVKHGITSFTAKSFVSAIKVIYDKMTQSNKQILLEHFSQKSSKKKQQQHQATGITTNQYKTFIDNQIEKCAHSSDKGISSSFSHNNILIKKPVMNYNSLLINNELCFPHYDSGKNYYI